MTTLPAGSLGVGTYRMRADNPLHREALTTAVSLGWTVIDTASNYGDGSAERLVGATLDDTSSRDVAVWTKAGYISPSLARALGPDRLARVAVRLSDEAYYSLHPDVLERSLELSLERLRTDKVAGLFLHNPEHAVVSGSPGAVYEQLHAAFEVCERLVRRGVLDAYGISSNALTSSSRVAEDPQASPDGADSSPALSLQRILSLANGAGANRGMRLLQVPMNLVERDAVEGPAPTLVGVAHAAGVRVAAQRPLTARLDGAMVRLIDGPAPDEVREARERGGLALDRVCAAVTARLAELGRSENALSFPIMRFLRDVWFDLPDVDLLDDVVRRRWQPFLAAVFDDVPADVVLDAQELTGAAALLARHRLSSQAEGLRARFCVDGLIAPADRRPLQRIAIDYPLTAGVDTVLVGVRRPEYAMGMELPPASAA